MTVSATTARNSYTASAAQTVFAYTFRILDEDHISVYVDDVLQTISTDYTVDGVGSSSGGNVTFTSGMTGGESVVFLRNVPLKQLTDYTAYDPFPAETHEEALDWLTMITQQLAEKVDRVPIMPPSVAISAAQFPSPVALELIRWNAAASALEGVALADLSLAIDTVLASQAANDILVWNGSEWVNRKQVTSAERTAGTETAIRSFAPADVKSMISAHAPSPAATTQQIFTSSGTWTKPSGCRAALVRLWGGGGGSGGSNGSGNSGPGGGAGYSDMFIDVTGIASATVTIGSAGAGGASSTADGSAGGTSSWSDGVNVLTANGGGGGLSYSNGGTAGTPGTASGGDRNFAGLVGEGAGAGGGSYGHPAPFRDGTTSVAGTYPGVGATAQKDNAAGEPGFRGECIVLEFY